MFDRLKSQFAALRHGRPGHRFQERYERNRANRDGPRIVWRIVRTIVALAFVALGVVFMFIPGPAILFYAIAGALLSTDSRPLARFLDWTEVRSRRVGHWIATRWNPLPITVKVALGTLGACGSIASTWLFYRFVAP